LFRYAAFFAGFWHRESGTRRKINSKKPGAGNAVGLDRQATAGEGKKTWFISGLDIPQSHALLFKLIDRIDDEHTG